MLLLMIFAFLFFCIVCIVLYNKEEFSEDTSCICVFDIDDTLTCGIDSAKKAIDKCREKSCKFAINTARTSKYYDDLNLEGLGLEPTLFKDDFYSWNRGQVTYNSYEDIITDVAHNKTRALEHLHKKYSVPKNKIILFDDNSTNIEVATKSGFSVIHANHSSCGLPSNVSEKIENILNNY